MTEENNKLEQNQNEKPMSFMAMVVITGLIGGILWSSLGYLAYVFKFTQIRPNIILEPWALGEWKNQGLGTVISIIVIGILAIVAALIYYVAFKKIKNILGGIGYGILLFLLVYIVLNPLFPGMDPLKELSMNTITTSLCLYILFGTFVGFSISYEYEEEEYRKKRTPST